MNYAYLSSIFGPIMIGAGLLVSGGIIAELANANIYANTHKWAVVKAKKMDVNNDGFVSIDELKIGQNQRFQKLNREADSQIDGADFNVRLEAMFNRMDSNGDGMLDDIEIAKLKHRPDDKYHDSRKLQERWL